VASRKKSFIIQPEFTARLKFKFQEFHNANNCKIELKMHGELRHRYFSHRFYKFRESWKRVRRCQSPAWNFVHIPSSPAFSVAGIPPLKIDADRIEFAARRIRWAVKHRNVACCRFRSVYRSLISGRRRTRARNTFEWTRVHNAEAGEGHHLYFNYDFIDEFKWPGNACRIAPHRAAAL